ncbi:PGBD5 (predicted) [Pycnogonum litorale]
MANSKKLSMDEVIREITENSGSEICSESDHSDDHELSVSLSSSSSDSELELSGQYDGVSAGNTSFSHQDNSNSGPSTSNDVVDMEVDGFVFDSDSEYDGDDEDEKYDHRLGWSRTMKPPLIPPFNPKREPGVHIDFEGMEISPLAIIEKFISAKMIKNMKKETNRYARQQRRGKVFSETTLKIKWKPVTEIEIKHFLAIIIHMGIVVKPKVSDYWSTDNFILMYFHLNDGSTYIPRGQPNHDPLHRVRPVFDELLEKFKIFYQPKQKIAIDEAMCAFRGRLHFRVYNPDKPDRYGIKMYELCDADTGFINNIEVYTGKVSDQRTDQSLTEQIVMRLIHKYLDQGYKVFMDNYYTSPALFDNLLVQETTAVGTLRKNRKEVPKKVLGSKLKKGQHVFRRRGQLVALRWRDKRDVLMLSTCHTNATTSVRVRRQEELIQKPQVVVDYNLGKKGVDYSDQMISYYAFTRKSYKWWNKLFFRLLYCTLSNAYIIYNAKCTGKPMTYVKFLESIAKAWANESEDSMPGPSRTTVNDRLKARHFCSYIPPTEKKRQPTRICKVCSEKSASEGNRVRKETRFWCQDCEIPLCHIPCFELFHTKKDYLS